VQFRVTLWLKYLDGYNDACYCAPAQIKKESQPMSALSKKRLQALDVFRGMTIAGMVLVNNPGSWSFVYPPLDHAEWNGWTPTDLIFPFFLFIVGVAMTYSFATILETGQKPKGIYGKIARRALILIGLGIFLALIPINFSSDYNWFRDTFLNVRLPGVLQRIGAAYFCASLIVLNCRPRQQVYWAVGLLVCYWAIMKLLPFTVIQEGVAVTYVGELTKEINFAAYVDNILFHGHTWQIGKYLHRDPEGLLSTVPAIATVLCGVFTGYWLKSGRPSFEMLTGLFVAGISGLVLGNILDYGFPINKWLWSPAYVVFMGGMALLFLAMCIYLIDVKQQRWWIKPFVIFGLNPIALYVLSGIVARVMLLIKVTAENISLKEWLYRNLFASGLGDWNGSLGFAVAYIVFWLGIMAILYKKQIFIKI